MVCGRKFDTKVDNATPTSRKRLWSPVMIRLESRLPSVIRAGSAGARYQVFCAPGFSPTRVDSAKAVDCHMAKKKVADLPVEVLAEV